MIKAIIFDCFGVLLADVLKAQRDSIAQINPEAAVQLGDIVQASNRGMITREESAKQMAEIIGIDYEQILSTADRGEVKNEQLMSFMRTLRPTYKVGLLSNVRSQERIEQRFDPGELNELFDVIVASGDVGYIKPERQIYELTAERLGVTPNECVMIDDIQEYCEGAEAAGIQAIQFKHTDQAIADLQKLLKEEKS